MYFIIKKRHSEINKNYGKMLSTNGLEWLDTYCSVIFLDFGCEFEILHNKNTGEKKADKEDVQQNSTWVCGL